MPVLTGWHFIGENTMATIDWEPTLPVSFIQDTYTYAPVGNILRTSMSSGPPKARRLFTATTADHTGAMVMTKAQVATFKTFFEDILGYGVNVFNFANPFDISSDIEVRFKINSNDPPFTLSPDGGTQDFRVAFVLEEMP